MRIPRFIKEKKMSNIRVTFNRQVTWAEIETFRVEQADIVHLERLAGVSLRNKWHFSEDREKLYISSTVDSRELFEYVADWAAKEVVNLHPTAVLTFED